MYIFVQISFMKKAIATLSLFLFVLIQSQTHRFFYTVNFKIDSLSNEYVKDLVVLDVDKDETKFYSNDFLTNDSIRIETGEYEFSYPKFKSSLKRKTGTGENTSYITLSPLYYSLKTNDIQHWKISDETKNIGNFKAQKATANFGGRHWEAWFSTELPFSEGPYKFRGLPGLILELKDSNENYLFSFVGNKNLAKKIDTTFFLENMNKEKPLLITDQQWKKLQVDYFINPMKDFDGDLIVEDKNGNKVKMNPRELTIRTQDHLRKNNNPIEIDKAIHYPKK
jgi:GLPGLI family protein